MYSNMFARGNRGLSGESMTASLIASTAENSELASWKPPQSYGTKDSSGSTPRGFSNIAAQNVIR